MLSIAVAKLAGREINRTAGSAEQKRILVPIIGRYRDRSVYLCEALNAGREAGLVGDVSFARVLVGSEFSGQLS